MARIWRDGFGGSRDADRWFDRVRGPAPVEAFVAEARTPPRRSGEQPAGTVDERDSTAAVVGFSLVAIADRAFLEAYLGDAVAIADVPNPVGIVHSGGVDPAWRSRGVGAGLVQRALDWTRERTDGGVLVTWDREDHPDVGDIAASLDCDRVATLDGYYADRTNCPDCGEDCECRANVWLASFED